MAGEPLVNVDETAPLRPDSPAPTRRPRRRPSWRCGEATATASRPSSLRPRFVWGLGDTTLLPEMVETVEAGSFAWVGGGGNVTDTTQVDNVVEGLVLAPRREAPGEAYFVTDGEPVVFREFVSDAPHPGGRAARPQPARPGRGAAGPPSASRPGSCCRSGASRR